MEKTLIFEADYFIGFPKKKKSPEMSYFCRNSYFREKEFDLLWLYMAAVPSCLLIAAICRGYLKSSLKRSVPSFMKTMSRVLYIDSDRETRNYLEV